MIHILSKGHIIFNTDTSSGLWRFGIESYLGKIRFPENLSKHWNEMDYNRKPLSQQVFFLSGRSAILP